jgi:hypothetical protein
MALDVVDTRFIQGLGLDPQCIAKLVHSTNISPYKAANLGFESKYDLVSALRDWAQHRAEDRLY